MVRISVTTIQMVMIMMLASLFSMAVTQDSTLCPVTFWSQAMQDRQPVVVLLVLILAFM
jgi:hypothetical protein